MNIRNVCCIGAGLIGHSWATLFSINGCSVTLCDLTDTILLEANKKIQKNLNFLTSKKYINQSRATSAMERISWTTDIQKAVRNADFIQESVFEDYTVKKRIFKAMDANAPADSIFASSSSGLLMSEIQNAVTKPDRCLIAHPWHPPHLLPLVELVPGKNTSSATIKRTHNFMTRIGKIPIILKKEVPGHIANRLQAAVWREAIDLVDRGVCSVEDVDKALVAGPGLRWAFMGSNLTLHLGGGSGGLRYFIKHLGPAFSSWWKDMSAWSQISPSRAAKIIQGIEGMDIVKSRTDADLMLWRDTKLIQLLKALYPP